MKRSHHGQRSILPRWLSSLIASAVMLMLALPELSGAMADDFAAALGADGLRLMKADNVVMKSEFLTIAPGRVHNRYVFRARSERPVQTLVAFPLPLVPVGGENIILPERKGAPEDIVNFRLTVDGRPVQPKIQVRALVDGIDKTAILRKYDLPLFAPASPEEVDALIGKLNALPPDARRELERHGLVEWVSLAEGEVFPEWHWDLKVLYYWEQVFPPDRDVVITHEYTPIAGKFFYTEMDPWIRETFCTDHAFRAAARRLGDEEAPPVGTHVKFILTTANSWAEPIGYFRLVIDKKRPDALVSLCWRGELRRISPTRFEFTAHDFSPRQDLNVMFLEPSRPPR